ncbi:MAG: MBOAT family protein [Alphaproteobacteria bacterium]|nr:MBOAT family protein [Alphaproteobacteria bacterium]
MNFVQTEFLGFLAIVWVAVWALGRLPSGGRRWQNVTLIAASAIFYGWVHPWFLLLLLASALTDYTAGRVISERPAWRDLALAASLAVNLGLLGTFKYLDFFLQSVADAATALGLHADVKLLGLVLPVGISFYTFQTMSSTIDVYRGHLRARRDLVDYLLYVMFFPQLVAGPIERAERLLVQVERPRTMSLDGFVSGVSLASWGAFKKLVVADTLAPYIDKVFVLQDAPGPLIQAGALAFSVQIYADFSGYTDIARGVARTLGFELSENFRSPYLSASTPEFWQRWHISLSTWIRDYLFTPLLGTGAQVSTVRLVGATMTTFALIGLWHGASWNFLLFGLWHGVWMTAYTLGGRWWGARPLPPRALAVVFHFVVVSLPGSLLFRETHLDRLLHAVTVSPWSAGEDAWIATIVLLGMTGAASVPLLVSWPVVHWLLPELERSPWLLPIRTTTWAVLAWFVFVFYRVSAVDFVYFQF